MTANALRKDTGYPSTKKISTNRPARSAEQGGHSKKRRKPVHMKPEALETLILEHREHGKRLAWSFLTSWRIRLPQDEVLSIVGAALCEAGTRFDPSRGVDFKTFFYYHLRGMLLKEISRIIQEQKLLQFVPHTAINGTTTPDAPVYHSWSFSVVDTNNPEKILEKQEVSKRCWEACAQLDPLEQEVIKRFFVEDQPLVQIAKELSYCRCHISRVKSRALKKLSSSISSCSSDTEGEYNELVLRGKATKTRRTVLARKRRQYTGGRGRRRDFYEFA
jgi:RNA polymerase sigma factor (sigma-70 family)